MGNIFSPMGAQDIRMGNIFFRWAAQMFRWAREKLDGRLSNAGGRR
jgi:hypothetical protein